MELSRHRVSRQARRSTRGIPRNRLSGSNRRREINDVEIKRELALAPFGFSNPSFAPIACETGRGVECGNVYLSGKIEAVDQVRNSIGSDGGWAIHNMKVKMGGGGVPCVSQF